MKLKPFLIKIGIAIAFLSSAVVFAYDNKKSGDEACATRYYVFSWNMADHCAMKPRGGTSKGVEVTLAKQPSAEWQALQAPDLSSFERDRRAILAMQGPYKTSFEFLETLGFSANFTPAAPYQSWGTEYVYVVEDRGDFISLQHIMVMFFASDDATENAELSGAELRGPMVMKHWRQDWQYQARMLLAFQGDIRWALTKLSKRETKGTWTQTVYQVDDSPRYGSFGSWQHTKDFSVWKSHLTRRPLPRRESSVRDDYDVLEGYNSHVILPNGWVQEEENYKVSLDDVGNASEYLAKELGVNRYQRISDFDWRAGDTYWQQTSDFWQLVREEFAQQIKHDDGIALNSSVDNQPLFVALFELADAWQNAEADHAEVAEQVKETIARYAQQ